MNENLKSLGYKFAGAAATTEEIARDILAACPTFLTEVPEEIAESLDEGFALKKGELMGEAQFARIDGNLVACDPTNKKLKPEVNMTLHYARSFTGQAFGKLKDTDPALHKIVGEWRDAWSKYRSARWKALTAAIREVSGGTQRKRSATKEFSEWLRGEFESAVKRSKTAKDRGDGTADPVRLKVAIDAFWKAYKK